MVERDEDARLTHLFKAVSDPTRRRILTLLVRDGPTRIGGLAAAFEVSLQAVSKHVRTLEEAGLVSRSRAWREHVIRAEPVVLDEVQRWMDTLRWIAERRAARQDGELPGPETSDCLAAPTPDGDGPLRGSP